jgi:hypothetical protein
VVKPDPGGLLDGLREQRSAADGERRVDLVLAVAWDRHVRVARDRHQRGGRARPDGGNVDQQDGVGAAVAHVVARGQLGLLLRGQTLAAVRANQQPGGALAGDRPLRIAGQRGDAVQRRVDPHAACHGGDDEHQHECQEQATPMSFAARRFRFGWRRRSSRWRWCGTTRWWRWAARGSRRVRRPRLGGRWWPVIRVTADHLRRLPALPRVRARRLSPVIAHSNELTTASRDDRQPAHSRRRRPSRSRRARRSAATAGRCAAIRSRKPNPSRRCPALR